MRAHKLAEQSVIPLNSREALDCVCHKPSFNVCNPRARLNYSGRTPVVRSLLSQDFQQVVEDEGIPRMGVWGKLFNLTI